MAGPALIRSEALAYIAENLAPHFKVTYVNPGATWRGQPYRADHPRIVLDIAPEKIQETAAVLEAAGYANARGSLDQPPPSRAEIDIIHMSDNAKYEYSSKRVFILDPRNMQDAGIPLPEKDVFIAALREQISGDLRASRTNSPYSTAGGLARETEEVMARCVAATNFLFPPEPARPDGASPQSQQIRRAQKHSL